MEDIGKLRDEFILDDVRDYWKEKMELFGKIMKHWLGKGVTVSVMDGEVVAIYGADELSTDQKHEVANATEGYLYAEGQYGCANDGFSEDSE